MEHALCELLSNRMRILQPGIKRIPRGSLVVRTDASSGLHSNSRDPTNTEFTSYNFIRFCKSFLDGLLVSFFKCESDIVRIFGPYRGNIAFERFLN